MNETRRQMIARILRERTCTLVDLAREIGSPVKSALADLEHARRGVRQGERFVITPAACAACGHVFRDRTRLETPSRCPRCKSERVDEPSFRIEPIAGGGGDG